MPRLTSLPRARRARSQRQGGASDDWLLLLFATAVFAVVFGLLYPRPPVSPPRAGPLTIAEARASNAAVPIRANRRVRAAPFRFAGGPAAREQAAECLATAALYEASDDRRGQRAVIQVILNRVRAPGFPKTVWGVVYQGYARATGCQFSFTCDGSVRRRPVQLGWAAAQRSARRALAGHIDAWVAPATHYDADWVVPFWRDSLTKVAQVGSHLFYVQNVSGARQ